jgi:type VI secretion system lysozyme-like protein
MSAPKIEVPTLLFDRLVDLDTTLTRELRPMRTLDRDGLEESVRREMERLLNTRTSFPADLLALRDRSVIDYGVPDCAMFSPRSFDDRARVAEHIRRAIVAYEPRLSEVRVTVGVAPAEILAMSVHIEAMLETGSVPEPVSFDTVLQNGEEVSVDAD